MLPDGYSLSNLWRAIREPERLRDEYHRRKESLYRRAIALNGQYYDWRRSTEGVDVMAADWDNLILLDACRPEILESYVPPSWTVERRLSKAPESQEFMRRNFLGDTHHDTVYVTANPYAFDLPPDLFRFQQTLLDTHWNEQHRTVMPEDVVTVAKNAASEFPEKRLVVHFMQPHFPFIGPTGQAFEHEGIEIHLPREDRADAPDPWRRQMFIGDIGRERLLDAYRENHELVVPHVRRLVEDLDGKTVVTADHANLTGERTFPVPIRVYGHPEGLYEKTLLTVPWLEFDAEKRRPITAETPVVNDGVDESTARDRLRDLGYA